jgi:hypothetical protein
MAVSSVGAAERRIVPTTGGMFIAAAPDAARL